MYNVLVNAYAISPNWGSEQGLGWNWVVNLSKYCNVFVITEGQWRTEIESAVAALPQKDNLHFYYNPVPDYVRDMCWNQGDWRFYGFYRKWQVKTLAIARQIIKEHHIDVIHQLNMIGYREPGSLWQIEGIPFVWGPVGAYGWTTLKYLNGQPLATKVKNLVKNVVNYYQGRFYPISNKAMRRADAVLAANSRVHGFIKRHHRGDAILMNETGCYVKSVPMVERNADDKNFNILWVGKFDYRKQLELAIRSVSQLVKSNPYIRLNIVGDTANSEYERLSKLTDKLGVAGNITWHGKIPNQQVHEMMCASDIFFFTSIDEGTPHVVLEAIQNNLPVVCFNTCGQGDVVTEKIGIKVPVTNFNDSQSLFADAIASLIEDRERLQSMRLNCQERQEELSWDNKVKQMLGIYDRVVSMAAK